MKFTQILITTCFFASAILTATETQIPITQTSTEDEQIIDDLAVIGEIPTWLKGTLIRNGPAKFESGGQRVDHWFDGLAMLEGFTFTNGKISYANRFLRSDNYHIMMDQDVMNVKGFGSSRSEEPLLEPEGGWRYIQNANVNVTEYGGNHVALTEVPLPVKFDLKTLQTLGNLEYSDHLPSKGVFESAHPERDPETHDQINFLIEFGPTSFYRIYKISEGSTSREIICDIPTDTPSYMHSFSITENYIILAEYPFRIDFQSLIANPNDSFMSHFKWEPNDHTVFTVVHRQTGEIISKCTTAAMYSWHHVNAYESNNEIVLDLITSRPPTSLNQPVIEGVPNYLKRFYLNIADHSVRQTTIFKGVLEMPWIREDLNGKPYRFAYAINDHSPSSDPSYVHPLYKIDVENHTVQKWSEKGCYPGEPVFVASPTAKQEDDGVILSLVLDEKQNKSFLLVLDAKTMKEIARALLPHHIPRGLHGAFFQSKEK